MISTMRNTMAAALLGAVSLAQAQVASYDAATMVVTIPSVSVGSATFTNVTLKNRGDFVFDLTGASEQKVPAPGVGSYDAATSVLTLPAVKVGAVTFLDVKLKNAGNFVFTLQAASELPAATIAEVDALARAIEAQTATALPANGTARLALVDLCWSNGGRTRANFIADYDANLTEYLKRDAFLIGRKIENIQVLALRNSVNADGSTRREIDVQWDVKYRDGTTLTGERQFLISGSSAGTPRCTTPQTGSSLRALGNQQLVATAARANNFRDERYSITNGAALSPLVMYRREVEWAITDPMGNATYVILTGPGPSNLVNGVVHPFSMKFISPRLLRSAPELQGKPGNFLNWRDDDIFRNCRLASGAVPVVKIVDCVTDGATGSSWGVGYTATPDEAADLSFEAQGWIAGGVYRFDVYNDDGWKTVNGHASKTPIASYYDTLDRLPYRFVDIAGAYPLINLGSMTTAQLAANATSATPANLSLTWTAPGRTFPGARVHHLNQVWEFQQGAKASNQGTTFNPAYRMLTRSYPGSTATSTTSFPVTPKLADQKSKTYTEYLLFYDEPGTANSIRSRISLQ